MSSAPPFEFIRGNERLDWGILVSIDAERLLANPNVETLQRIVGNLGFSHIHREEVAMFNADHVVHLLRLYQLIVQYVIYSQDCLAKLNSGITKRNTELRQQIKEVESNLAAVQAENSELQKALAAANACSLSRKANGTGREAIERAGAQNKIHYKADETGLAPASVHVCPFCQEQYHKIESLQSHLRKRHAISAPAQPVPIFPPCPQQCDEKSPDSPPVTEPTKVTSGASHRNSSNSEEVKVLSRRVEELEKQVEQERKMAADTLIRDHHYLMMLLLQCCRGAQNGNLVFPSELPPNCQKLFSCLYESGKNQEISIENLLPSASGPSLPSLSAAATHSAPSPSTVPSPAPLPSLPSPAEPANPQAQPHVSNPDAILAPSFQPAPQSSFTSVNTPEASSVPHPSSALITVPSVDSGSQEAVGAGRTENWSRLPFSAVGAPSTSPPPPSHIATVPVVPDVAAFSSALTEQINYRQELYERELSMLRGELSSLKQEWHERQQPCTVISSVPASAISTTGRTTSTSSGGITAPTAVSSLPPQTVDPGKAVDNLAKYGPPGAAFIPPKRTPSPQRMTSPSRPVWLSSPPPPSVYPVRGHTATPPPGEVMPGRNQEQHVTHTTMAGSTPSATSYPSSSPSTIRTPSTTPPLTSFERVQGDHCSNPSGKDQAPQNNPAASIPNSCTTPAVPGSPPTPAAPPAIQSPVAQVQAPPAPLPPPVAQVQAPPAPLPPPVAQVQAPSAPLPSPVAQVQLPGSPIPPSVASPVSVTTLGPGESMGTTSGDGVGRSNPWVPPVMTARPVFPVEVPKPATSSLSTSPATINVVKKFNPAASDSSYSYSYSED